MFFWKDYIVVLLWTSSRLQQRITYGGFDLLDSSKPIAFFSGDDCFFELDLGVFAGVESFKFFDDEAYFFHILDGLPVVFHLEIALRYQSYGFNVIDFHLWINITLLDFICP